MKRIVMLTLGLLCLFLTSCSAAAFFLSGCGSPEADLVVVNDSGWDVYSIVLEYESSTGAVQAANGSPLLKPGESYGLLLEDGEVVVTLRDLAQRTIGQSRVTRQEGQRLYLTFDGVTEGSLSVEEWPHG